MAERPKKLGKVLRDRREDLDLSRAQVVAKTGRALSESYLELIETKGANPSAKVLGALAAAYQIDPLYLLVLGGHLPSTTKVQEPTRPAPHKDVAVIAGREFRMTPRNQRILAQMAEAMAKEDERPPDA